MDVAADRDALIRDPEGAEHWHSTTGRRRAPWQGPCWAWGSQGREGALRFCKALFPSSLRPTCLLSHSHTPGSPLEPQHRGHCSQRMKVTTGA